jgi:rhamnose transport system substrate-binding protein
MKKSLQTDAKFKDMELVEVVYGDDEAEKSATEMQALLTAHPDLAGVVAPTTVGVRAGAQVLSNSPLKDKVALTGLGAPNEMREYIKDGTVEKFALWDPKLQGLIGSHLLMGMIAGEIEPDGGTSFEVPDVGTVEISQETQILAGPPQVFDQANIDDFDF